MIKKILLSVVLLVMQFQLSGQNKYYTNPVSDTIFIADPFILNHEGLYYLYGTTASSRGFQYWTSINLVDWQPGGFAYERTENSWGQTNFWAPEVISYNNRFYMIFSSTGQTMFGNGLRLCIAVSDKPSGPFVDLYAPLFDLGFSCIDGHIFLDDDTPYLYYEMVGSVGEFRNNDGFLWGYIFGVELSPDLSGIKNEPTLCLYPSQEWEGVNSMKARSNEGMTVFRNNGIYYMTYSGNHYEDPNYGVGYATSSKPLGMWTKSVHNPILKRNIPDKVSGPGHNSIIKSPDNSEWFIIYHSHASLTHPNHVRILNIDRLKFLPDGSLKVHGPTRTPQPYPSGAQ
jgi:GH43 family beta-xylosidase